MKKTYETMTVSVISLSNEDILTLSIQNCAEDREKIYKMNVQDLYT